MTASKSLIPSASTPTWPATLTHAKTGRDRAKRQTNATASGRQSIEVSSMESPSEFVQLAHIHRGECLSDAEHENAEHHNGDHDVEENADFHYERHSIGCQDNRREHDAIFHREERQNLSNGLAAVYHQEKAGQE